MITIIVAYDENRLIGNKGTLPWNVPDDLKNFKELTTNQICIMGMRTWDSIPSKYKPLPNRYNIIVTSYNIGIHENYHFEESVENAISFSQQSFPEKEIFIIGGQQIYEYVIKNNLADRILASEIKGKYDGDKHFPEINSKKCTKLKEFPDFNLIEYKLND